MSAPVEVTTRYVTTVDSLTAAWRFVMAYVDSVGLDPSVTIRPIWITPIADMDRDDAPPTPRQFEVVVEGMVEES